VFCNTRKVTGIKPVPRSKITWSRECYPGCPVLDTTGWSLVKPCFNMGRALTYSELNSTAGPISLLVKGSISAFRHRTKQLLSQ